MISFNTPICFTMWKNRCPLLAMDQISRTLRKFDYTLQFPWLIFYCNETNLHWLNIFQQLDALYLDISCLWNLTHRKLIYSYEIRDPWSSLPDNNWPPTTLAARTKVTSYQGALIARQSRQNTDLWTIFSFIFTRMQ